MKALLIVKQCENKRLSETLNFGQQWSAANLLMNVMCQYVIYKEVSQGRHFNEKDKRKHSPTANRRSLYKGNKNNARFNRTIKSMLAFLVYMQSSCTDYFYETLGKITVTF